MRRTVGWSSMTRILGALRTSGSVTLAARKKYSMAHSPDSASSRTGTGEVREYYSRSGLPVIVIQVTLVSPSY